MSSVEVFVGDTLEPLGFRLRRRGAGYTPPVGTTITLELRRKAPISTLVGSGIVAVDVLGTGEYIFTPGDVATPGVYFIDVVLALGGRQTRIRSQLTLRVKTV